MIHRCFDFLNEIMEKGDEKVHQMVRVTTFEILTDQLPVMEEANKWLNGKALIIFLEVVKFIRG